MPKESEQLKNIYREFIIDCIENEIQNSDNPEELHNDEVLEILDNDPDLQTLRQLATTIYADETKYYMQLTDLEEASEEGFSQEFIDLLDERIQKWSNAEKERKAEQERQIQAELKEAYYLFIAHQMNLTESIGDYEDYPEERHFNVEDLKALTDLESMRGYAAVNLSSAIEKLPYPENLSDDEIQLMSGTERLNALINNWYKSEGIDLQRPDLELEDHKYQQYMYEKNYKPEVNELSDEEKEQLRAWLAEQEQKEAGLQAANDQQKHFDSFGEEEIEQEPEEDYKEQIPEENELQSSSQKSAEQSDPEQEMINPEEISQEPILQESLDQKKETVEEFDKLQPRRRSNSFVASKPNITLDEKTEDRMRPLSDFLGADPDEIESGDYPQTADVDIDSAKTEESQIEEELRPVNEAIYNKALLELNADLEKTKSVFSSDSKEFTRIKTYLTEISKLDPLDRDQLRQVFNLLKTSVEDYREHAKNNPRPQDNWRRNTRLGIMDKIASLADDFDHQVYDPKETYEKRASECLIDAMLKNDLNVDKNTFAKAFTGLQAYKKTMNELSIFELDRIANDPKEAKKIGKNIRDLETKLSSKSRQNENKITEEINIVK